MSDDAYRSTQPKLVVTNGVCIVIEQIAAVVKYQVEIKVFLKTGQDIYISWSGDEAKTIAEHAYKTISDALQEFMR